MQKSTVLYGDCIKNKIRSDAFNLLRLNQKKFSNIPDGNIITKHYVQKKKLSDGSYQIYRYEYECLDYKGKQEHLSVKNKNSESWKLREDIMEKRSVENEKRTVRESLIENIKIYYGCKDRKAEKHLVKILEKAQRDIDNRKNYKKSHTPDSEKETKENYFNINGYSMRSKNEMIFASMLDELRVPYLFEMQLKTWYMGRLFPDFTIFVNDDFIHVELLGMLDKEDYCSDFEIKQKKYQKIREKVVYLDVTDGIDMRKLKEIIYKILNCDLNVLNGQLIRCAPETVKLTSMK